MKDEEFVRLTGKILKMEGLTSTDKIVLAYRLGWGKKPYFEKVATLATVLNMGVKTVEKSITKLRRLGHWPAQSDPTGVGTTSYSGRKANPTRVETNPTGVGTSPTRVGKKKSFSPMKTDLLLDSILDNRLDKDKIVRLDSSAGASPLSHQPQTSLKKLWKENTASKKTEGIKISKDSGSEAPIKDCNSSVPPAVPPLGPDGRPLTKAEMNLANFDAIFADRPERYSAEQVQAGREADTAEDFDRLFGNKVA